MPKGQNGENRSADAIGLAVMVGRIATGEAEDVARGCLDRRNTINYSIGLTCISNISHLSR
jgi:hypothetical protein